MSTTMVVDCPKCKNQLKGPPSIQGKKVRCKRCGEQFRIPAAGEKAQKGEAKPARKATPAESDHGDAQNPYDFAEYEPAAEVKKDSGPLPKGFAKSTPYGITEVKLDPRCPHCAKEMESAEAVICLNCGYNLATRQFARTKVVYHITPKDRMAWLMPAFLCLGGIAALLALDAWICFGLNKFWASWEDYVPPSFTKGLRAWFVFITCVPIWLALRFSYKRLILEPSPPEVEKRK